MKKTLSFLCLLLFVNIVVVAQQDPQFTNNMYYKLGANPGYAGASNAINGLLLNRYQWVGYGGGEPKTLVFSADAAVNAFGAPGGVGINVVSDEWGYFKNMWVNFNYSYKLETRFGTLGIGVSPGFFNFNINPDQGWLTSDDVWEGRFQGGSQTGDAFIPQEETSQLAFDIGMGAYLHTNKYYLGVSASHLNQAPIKYNNLEIYYLARNYTLMGGYNIKLTDPLFELRPSFLLKSELASWQLDANINVVYDDRLWAGFSYRLQDAVALLMGVELMNGLRIGYSFDLVTSSVRRYAFSSHEIFISYSIDLERSRNQKYKSIRFL